MPNPQIQNVLSEAIAAQRQLYDLVTTLKGIRGRIEDLGLGAMTGQEFVAAITPTGGGPHDLDHLSLVEVGRLLGAMDVLDAALLTPVNLLGQTMTPRKAIVDVIR